MTGPAAREDPGLSDPLFATLQEQAGDKFPYCRRRILFRPEIDAIAGSELIDAKRFEEVLAPFAASYPDADRRAVISMWSLYYFSALFIPATIFALVLGRSLPLALSQTRIVVDPQKGTPTSFIIPDTAHLGETDGIHDRMQTVMQDHAGIMIDFLRAHAGLSRKLLWNNVASYLSWAVEEAGRHLDEELAAEGQALLDDAHLPNGSSNPLCGLLRGVETNGHVHRRRRLCCLRYLLPGVSGCGLLCPVPEGRLARL